MDLKKRNEEVISIDSPFCFFVFERKCDLLQHNNFLIFWRVFNWSEWELLGCRLDCLEWVWVACCFFWFQQQMHNSLFQHLTLKVNALDLNVHVSFEFYFCFMFWFDCLIFGFENYFWKIAEILSFGFFFLWKKFLENSMMYLVFESSSIFTEMMIRFFPNQQKIFAFSIEIFQLEGIWKKICLWLIWNCLLFPLQYWEIDVLKLTKKKILIILCVCCKKSLWCKSWSWIDWLELSNFEFDCND